MPTPRTQAQLLSVLKSAGYSQVLSPSASSKKLIIRTPEKDRQARKKLLQALAKVFGASGRWVSDHSVYGHVLVDNTWSITHKPSSGAGASGVGSLSALDARKFAGRARQGRFKYHGHPIPVATFTSAAMIKKSIIEGCASASQLGKGVASVFEDFFAAPRSGLDWRGIDMAVRKKLGVYVGELLVGWVLLGNKAGVLSIQSPLKGRPTAFHVPTDPAFRGVDSFLEMQDKSFYGISSKYGVGAKASFFGNLLVPARELDAQHKLQPGVLKNIVAAAAGHTEKDSRTIVYAYGVRYILKIPASQLSDAGIEAAALQIIAGKKSPEVATIQAAIQSWYANSKNTGLAQNINPQIKDALPLSITAFFNQVIAAQINQSKADLAALHTILVGKDYWQANLKNALWEKDQGQLGFSFLSTKSAKVRIIGSKAPITDPAAKQGWVNYELFA
jgi:hypothetical protein